MAPKRRGSGLDLPVARGKRSARRPARAPSPSVSSSSSASTPSAAPGPSSHPVDTLAGRVITMGRKVDFHLFEREGFSIGRLIKDLKWDKLCSLDLPTYPALVKEFYFNLSRGDGGIVSEVRGKRIHLTADILGDLLGIPIRNLYVEAPTERSIALSRMLGREISDLEEVSANQLPLELRLLHNICGRILFPKIGRFEYVSERDIMLMDSILTGLQIDLAGMMIWYMAEAASKRRSTLPYGMVLTLVFQSQGVVISETEPKKNLRHTDYYSLATVHRMGFVKRNGSWERKGTSEDRAAPGPSMTHDSPPAPVSPSVPAPIPPPAFVPPSIPSSSFSESQLDQLKSLLDNQSNSLKAVFDSKIEDLKTVFESKFEEMKGEFDSKFMSLKESLFSLDDRVSKIESTFGTATENLKADLEKIVGELGEIGGDSETYSRCNAELQEKIVVASAFIDRRLTEFVRVQNEGMNRIVDDIQRLIRRA